MSEFLSQRSSFTPTLGLFGFGAFGQLVAAALREFFRITVHDPSEEAQARAAGQGLATADLASAAASDVVVLAIPVQAFEGTLRAIAPRLTPGAFVVDVASVKEGPARLMHELLPKGVRIVGTHPMFGPRSAEPGATGLKVVVCPVRDQAWRRVAAFLRHRGLRVIVATPEEHDRQAALTQGLTHLLARALPDQVRHLTISTRSFDLLMTALAMVRDDAPEIFEAVTRSNRHVAGLRAELIRSLSAGSEAAPE